MAMGSDQVTSRRAMLASLALTALAIEPSLARIATSGSDAIFTFMPGGMGVNLVKQYAQAGLAGEIPFLSAFTVDETTLPATQDAALGLQAGAQWAPNLDNAANKEFVAAFEAEYGYAPATYAAQGYDAARLIDAALKKAADTSMVKALKAGKAAQMVKAWMRREGVTVAPDTPFDDLETVMESEVRPHDACTPTLLTAYLLTGYLLPPTYRLPTHSLDI